MQDSKVQVTDLTFRRTLMMARTMPMVMKKSMNVQVQCEQVSGT
jgi:hypothetical protein